jgi:hypothetical protein
MTALVLKPLTARPAFMRRLRTLFARLARAIDTLVSARAARAVPEWQMQEVQNQISRYCDHSDCRPNRAVEMFSVSEPSLRKTGILVVFGRDCWEFR